MRKRINTNAICSSENYKASRKAHIEMLREHHSTFVPVENNTDSKEGFKPFKLSVAMVAVSIFGKKVVITKDEYDEHCQGMNYQYV